MKSIANHPLRAAARNATIYGEHVVGDAIIRTCPSGLALMSPLAPLPSGRHPFRLIRYSLFRMAPHFHPMAFCPTPQMEAPPA
jgi:hypothetical protein